MTSNKTEALFTIRAAREADEPFLALLFESEAMPLPSLDDLLSGTVAVNDDDEPVGFIRILVVSDEFNTAGDGSYVYPVIVFEHWRGLGVAAALVDYELERHGELKLVACRPSRGFYERTGFAKEDWANIAGVIARDCELCADLESCEPQPFVRRLQSEGGCCGGIGEDGNTACAEAGADAGGEAGAEAGAEAGGVAACAYDADAPQRTHDSELAALTLAAHDAFMQVAGKCPNCDLCAERCEVYDGLANGLRDVAASGLSMLEPVAKADAWGDAQAVAEAVHAYVGEHPDVYTRTRSCSYCNHCTAFCPAGRQATQVMSRFKMLYARAGFLDPSEIKSVQVDTEWHIFSVYRAVYGIHYPEFLNLATLGRGEADTVFFPGCSLVSYAPEIVRAVGSWLSSQGLRWALSESCCASPLVSHGRPERALALKQAIVAQCLSAGVRRILTVCPGCGEELAAVAPPELEIVPLPWLLADAGLSAAAAAGGGAADDAAATASCAVFDSCHDRSAAHGQAIREMLCASPGLELRVLEHECRNTLCCGSGGGVGVFDAELGQRRLLRILGEAEAAGASKLVVSCPTCAYAFAYHRQFVGFPPEFEHISIQHYLELVFAEAIDWSLVFQQLQDMWSGEYAAWVISQLA